jgi:imidazole glycerol-phosphate synthase subunit HisF
VASIRLIARLDIKGPNVIKGVHLEGLRVVGAPGAIAREYYEQGIDEIVYMDVVASLYGRNSIFGIVSEAAKDIFVPLTVGGGIRTTDDIVGALHSGADKVAINTAAIHRPEFISEAAEVFGSQCIVLSVEAKRRAPGRWEALTDNGRETTGVDALDWVERGEKLGAGEILITSVDMEGTQHGFDAELLRAVRGRVSIPVIASGGAGSPAHVLAVAQDQTADAIACASIFHYRTSRIADVKAMLAAAGIKVRQ